MLECGFFSIILIGYIGMVFSLYLWKGALRNNLIVFIDRWIIFFKEKKNGLDNILNLFKYNSFYALLEKKTLSWVKQNRLKTS